MIQNERKIVFHIYYLLTRANKLAIFY